MGGIALLFPGQGSHYIGMGKTLFQEHQIVKQVFEEANEILGFNLKKLCFEGSLSELSKIESMLPAILTVSVASFRVYMKEIGIAPRFLAGHSLGEYSALTCSGAIDFTDALKIVRLRSKLAQECADRENGIMTVVNGINNIIVEEECRKASDMGRIVSVACYNSPDQFVISGHSDAVMSVEDRIMELDGQITPLLTSAPFHCSLMQKAADEIKEILASCSLHEFNLPVISNVTALPYSGTDKLIENITLQMTKPVQWQATMNYLMKRGVTAAIEIGPQPVLTNLVTANTENIEAFSFDRKEDRKTLIEIFSSKNTPKIEKPENRKTKVQTVITRCLGVAVATRNRNWDEAEYLMGVIEPYEKIERMQEQLEKEDILPTVEQMQEALEMLKSVFVTKKVPIDLQTKRFNQILEETGSRDIFPNYSVT